MYTIFVANYITAERKNAKQNRNAKKKIERKGAMSVEFSQVVYYAMYTIFDHFFTEINHQSQLEVGESKIGESLSLE